MGVGAIYEPPSNIGVTGALAVGIHSCNCMD